MARRPSVKPRKQATQERSRATVQALVDATARVLVREGYDKASTNRVAQIAGVSIGSLYQYFPGKDALVRAVAQQHGQELARVARGSLQDVAGLPLAQGIGVLVAAALRAHRTDPRLHRVLAEEIPRVGALKDVGAFDPENYALFRDYLQAHRDEVRVVDLELASFVCVTTIEALTHAAVLHPSDGLSSASMDALVDEAARLIAAYLMG